jgi:hypothetical protein
MKNLGTFVCCDAQYSVSVSQHCPITADSRIFEDLRIHLSRIVLLRTDGESSCYGPWIQSYFSRVWVRVTALTRRTSQIGCGSQASQQHLRIWRKRCFTECPCVHQGVINTECLGTGRTWYWTWWWSTVWGCLKTNRSSQEGCGSEVRSLTQSWACSKQLWGGTVSMEIWFNQKQTEKQLLKGCWVAHSISTGLENLRLYFKGKCTHDQVLSHSCYWWASLS